MTIANVKDLDKLLQLCRKRGVKSIKIDNIELELGEAPVEAPKRTKHLVSEEALLNKMVNHIPTTVANVSADLKIPTDGLSYEQLLFYSAPDEVAEQPNDN